LLGEPSLLFIISFVRLVSGTASPAGGICRPSLRRPCLDQSLPGTIMLGRGEVAAEGGAIPLLP
jgi:hypothetical protein